MDIASLVLLSRIPGVGPRRIRVLVERFGDPAAVFGRTVEELVRGAPIDEHTARAVLRAGCRQAGELRAGVERKLEALRRLGGRVVTLWDPSYPPLLSKIHNPPPLLYVRGPLCSGAEARMLAVVGTRRPTAYAIGCARTFALALGEAGFTVVSGLARGIDTAAHAAALDAGGRTIGILGSGVDVIYPPENAPLAERMAREGALMSEFEPGTGPRASNFPRRNRIISGLCLGTLVIETGVRGGAMITASLALEQNREVFAVPSAVDPQTASGTNLLIRRGEALLVERPQEILRELEPLLGSSPQP